MSLTPKDLFGLVVRAFGLYFLRESFSYAYSFCYYCRIEQSAFSERAGLYVLFGIFYFVLGAYFVSGAPRLVRWSYREAGDECEKEADAEPGATASGSDQS